MQTPSQTVGPFFEYGLVFGGENILVNDQTQGDHIRIIGTLFDGDGAPVLDGLIEIWQADANGIYQHPNDPQYANADPNFRNFGRAQTVDNGSFSFTTIKPGAVSYDGQTPQAPHINVHVFARGMLVHAHTRIYFSDEPANESDPVLNGITDTQRRQTLIAQHESGTDLPTYCFNIMLQGDNETIFFEL